ncbi:MAG: hypothetical protein ACE5IL_00070 [Myxococcota bacterium]
MLETRGAPRDQGRIQAQRLPTEIRDAIAALRGARGALRWRQELRGAERGVGRSLSRFAPQLHERLQGIAWNCDLPVAALVLAESVWRGTVRALAKDGAIEARVAPPAGLDCIIRTTRPDAGGFPSAELTCAPLASALAGVNGCGIAVACLDSGPRTALPARVLVSDVLLRTRSFAAALDHVQRRAHYLQATGSLLVASADGEAAQLELRAGRMRVVSPSMADGNARNLRLDASTCALEWGRGTPLERVLAPSLPSEVDPAA